MVNFIAGWYLAKVAGVALCEEVLAEILHRDGLPCERSSEGSDHAAFLLSFERRAAEDLSGLPTCAGNTCPA
jgi:hypothetical protein